MRQALLVVGLLCTSSASTLADDKKPAITDGAIVTDDPFNGVDPNVRRYVPHLRQVLKSELRFVQTVCEPSPDAYRKIEAAGNAAFNDTLKKLGDQHKQRGGLRPQQQALLDPRQLIADRLSTAVSDTLPSDQAKRYQAELAQRREARQRAVVLNMVASLDRQLGLSTEQRGQLVESLNKEWKDAWLSQLEIFLFGEEFAPLPPEAVVLPVLNARQRDIWKSAPPRSTIHVGFPGFDFMQVIDLEGDVPLLEVPPP